MAPEWIYEIEEPAAAERARGADVGVKAPLDHLSLRRVAVDIPAEHGRHDKDGDYPGNQDRSQPRHRDGRLTAHRADQLEPRSEHQHYPDIDEHDPEEAGRR